MTHALRSFHIRSVRSLTMVAIALLAGASMLPTPAAAAKSKGRCMIERNACYDNCDKGLGGYAACRKRCTDTYDSCIKAADKKDIGATIETTREAFTDRPSKDYRYFNTNDSRICQNACVGEAGCAAWTYVEPGVQASSGRCWLKASVPGARQHEECTSGVKISTEPGIDRPGSDYKRFGISAIHPNGPEFCQAVCVGEAPRCRAWTYVKPGIQESSAVCYLKDEVPAERSNECCTSGFVGNPN